MRLAIVVLAALLLIPLLGVAYADEGYIALVEDSNLKISVTYPPEVKVNSCFNLRFQADAFNNMTIETLRLKVVYYYDGGSDVLYDENLVDSLYVERGWVLMKTISICVSRRRVVEPFLEARVTAEYRLDTLETRELTHEWYMSIVREKTYEELQSELESANERVESLEKQVDELLDEIDDLMARLDGLQEQFSELNTSHQTLLENYNSLQDQYSKLEEKYNALNEEYRQILVEYERLRTQHEQLSSTYQQLSSNYQSLLSDYQETLSELSQLKAVYQDLEQRYGELKERHEAALTTIGGLQSNVEDLKSRLAEKEEAYQELQAMYNSAVNEGTLTRSVLYAQSAAVAGIGAGIMIFTLTKKKRGAESTRRPEGEGNGEGNGRGQRILSGRRVTLPKEAFQKLGLKEGGRVVVQLLEDGVKVTPLKEEQEKQPEEKQEEK